jgi:hypothetical protein
VGGGWVGGLHGLDVASGCCSSCASAQSLHASTAIACSPPLPPAPQSTLRTRTRCTSSWRCCRVGGRVGGTEAGEFLGGVLRGHKRSVPSLPACLSALLTANLPARGSHIKYVCRRRGAAACCAKRCHMPAHLLTAHPLVVTLFSVRQAVSCWMQCWTRGTTARQTPAPASCRSLALSSTCTASERGVGGGGAGVWAVGG